ncbi:MAG TPA: restriction endonuclease [Chitinophagaceae bacterium]|nr:restriction endonuclease [Chitinophagaceae bacterium]
MKIFKNNELSGCDLIIDAIYEGGRQGNSGDDPINKILPVGNQGGFRYAGNIDNLKYVVLYSSGENLDWPDNIDTETGIFKYYGDNKKPGHEIHDTKKKGNLMLKNLFEALHSIKEPRKSIPPIFIFEKHPTAESSRSVQFKGLCVPGTIQKNALDDLVAIWKTSNGFRFQNYAAYFTILDVAHITRTWINDLNRNISNSIHTPKVFLDWLRNGKYKPLLSQRTISIRSVDEQLPKTEQEISYLKIIFEYFEKDPRSFEFMAAEVYKMTNPNIIIDEVTRGVVDGGRDALGRMKLGLDNDPIFADFALEAKCYNPGINNSTINTVGVKEISRLISRIRNRQFGILVTTSAISKQAYEEVRNDRHPIIFISGGDIVKILIEKGFNTTESLKKYLIDNFQINGT